MNADPESLLAALAAINAELLQLETACRAFIATGTTTRACDVRDFGGKVIFEAYVEVEKAEIAVCWWIDLTLREGGWVLDRAILRTDRDGQRTLRSFESRPPGGWPDLSVGFAELIRELTHREAPAAILREAFAGS